MTIKRVFIVIIDACGVGALPDAERYDDAGAATLQHCAEAADGLEMPHCRKLGLGNIADIRGVPPARKPEACFGKMAEQSAGKDSTTGHWEIGGIITDQPFPTYPNGFPEDLVRTFEARAGIKTIGNKTASGTEIIEELGEEHIRTGAVILYTSADSVWQLAAHEDIYPLQQQYQYCQMAREMLTGEHAVGRVIARPFVGRPGSFVRTPGRKDFSVEPPEDTLLDVMISAGYKTYAIGKIRDLFAERGITTHVKTAGNDEGMQKLIEAAREDREHQLVFANLVDFDQLWGHRRDPHSFAKALEAFDRRLGELLQRLREDDLLIITADHGCDPTYDKHTDHTREYVPLLVYGKKIKAGVDLGTRDTMTDVALTVAEIFDVKHRFTGESFLRDIRR